MCNVINYEIFLIYYACDMYVSYTKSKENIGHTPKPRPRYSEKNFFQYVAY